MAKPLSLDISELLFDKILQRANQINQTPEKMVMIWIEKAVKQAPNDALLQLAGIFQSDITDIGERHNEYLGKQLANNNE
ncbi:MAG: hypothetical protein KAH84_04695 [Thiomargarita sp.]|nr:hypothetical protein [Thiomargarita sp.]